MTIELKCPYSEEELEEIKKIRNNFTNTSVVCPFCGGPVDYKNELSIALMQTQHDLEICKQALINAKDKLEGAETSLLFLKCNLTAAGLRTEIADIDNTLKQITHDQQQQD